LVDPEFRFSENRQGSRSWGRQPTSRPGWPWAIESAPFSALQLAVVSTFLEFFNR
jgi:hypothetical protein